MKQRTLSREVTVNGTALHSGETVTLTLKPAPIDHGITFKRIDLDGSPEIRPSTAQVTDLTRATTIQTGHAKVQTVEHVLAALSGYGIDNAIVEMNASEPPIVDGSSRPFVDMILEAEPVEQDKEREYFVLDQPVSVSNGNSSIVALPCDVLKITCTSADDRGVHTQHLSLTIDPEVFRTQVSSARTFTVYEDIEPLLKIGKIKGGSLDCAVVIKGDKIMSKDPLRFQDEFVRHKILDIIGDIVLLGVPLKAHIVATRPGHALNNALTKALAERLAEVKKKGSVKKKELPPALGPTENSLDIKRVMDLLPHRYPFVMVDRVLEFKDENEIVALKNVTINEPYFMGHFPDNPVMPGVLQLEAMAQTAGILLLKIKGGQKRQALFLSADKVKWRKPVRPGDQLVITAKLLKTRGGKIGIAEGRCTVDGTVVSSAELMFTLLDDEGEAGPDAQA